MPPWSTISLFIVAASILVVIPGPNTFYIITRSLHQGLAAGVVSSLGILVGTVFHISAAAFGLSALLLSSALAFTLVKYAGAAYLVYLGLRTLLSKEKAATEMDSGPEKNLTGTFYQGVLVNVLNPKTALFFVAFLPQFLDVHGGSIAAQIFILGGILILLGISSDMTYALLAGKIGNRLRKSFRFARAQRYLAGMVYVGLGAATALTGMSKE